MPGLNENMRDNIKNLISAKPKPSKNKNKRRTSAGLWVKPHHSDALGVNPEQIPEAKAALKAHGITAEFDKEGRCIVTSEKQFRQVAKACGMWTGRDGYGVQTSDGNRAPTGRDREKAKAEFRRAVERGDFD